jgi:amidase
MAADAGRLANLDGVATAEAIAKGEITALEAANAALERLERANSKLGAVVAEMIAQSREKAAAVTAGGRLAGVPILVKDLLDVKGAPTRRGSRATPDTNAQSQSPFIDALEAAGLVIVGKSQTPEFGSSATTEPLLGPVTHNPVNPDYSAGGSSGGSAAAVAAGFVPIAQGSDGGGSLRMPASCCGVFALKVSRGRMIADGSVAARIQMTVQGCVTRTVRDTAAFLSVAERRDATAAFAPVGFVSGPSRRRLKIGLNLATLSGGAPHPEVARVIEATAGQCRRLGHDVRPSRWSFDGPALEHALSNSLLLAFVHIGTALSDARHVPLEQTGLEPLHVRFAQAGQKLSPQEAQRVEQVLLETQARYGDAFATFDVILTPTLAAPPVRLGVLDDPNRSLEEILAGYTAYSPYTAIENVAGAVAMSVPTGLSAGGLPIGAHFAAQAGQERMLLELAYELEREGPWRPAAQIGRGR